MSVPVVVFFLQLNPLQLGSPLQLNPLIELLQLVAEMLLQLMQRSQKAVGECTPGR